MAALVYAAKGADCPFEIVLVAANEPKAQGLKLAEAEGIPTFALSHKGLPRTEFDMVVDAEIRNSGAEYVALAGYMRLLSPEFVARWQNRMLNIHPSLLPKYKGLDTHARALAAGDKSGGCSVHIVTAELDDGEVLGQTEVAILPNDTEDDLAARVLIAEHQLYSRMLAEFVTRATRPEAIIDCVRKRALALPEADEVLSHGMPCFGISKGKKFAYVSQDHHGDGKLALLVKISGLDEQNMLIEQDPDRYYRPAYFGDGWIAIRLDLGAVDWDDVDDWLRRSWSSVAPKKLTSTRAKADEF